MTFKFLKIIAVLFFSFFTFNKSAVSEILKDFRIIGNDRISKETIIMFSNVSLNENIDSSKLNEILNNLYDTNFFENISINFLENILEIQVSENPIIENINIEGIKSNRINDLIKKNINLKSRSSYNENILEKDSLSIKILLKELGYYFPTLKLRRKSER